VFASVAIHGARRVAAKNLATLDVRTRERWRSWLQEHHASEAAIWLVFHKRHSGEMCIDYDAAVEEALCFGWVDSLIKRLDDDRYARKFTPRKPDSKWSTANRKRYADLAARGLLAAPGIERPPSSRSGDAPRPDVSMLPSYIEERLRADPRVWTAFEKRSLSDRQKLVAWIDSAKRAETKESRLLEVIAVVASGRKLGLK
jgi:uncharacterized protein YdeI (YjbR/CyaY-like superfamily)